MEPTTSIEDFLPLSELFDDDDIETDVQPIRTLDVKAAFLHSDAYDFKRYEHTSDICMALPSEPQENIILSLCDGMGCLALSLKEALPSYRISKYIAIEKDAVKRRVADAANPRTKTFPGIEHGLNHHHDIYDITEDDIKAIPKDQLRLIGAGPECNDFSKP